MTIYITPSHTSTDYGGAPPGIILDAIESRHVEEDPIVYICAEWCRRVPSGADREMHAYLGKIPDCLRHLLGCRCLDDTGWGCPSRLNPTIKLGS